MQPQEDISYRAPTDPSSLTIICERDSDVFEIHDKDGNDACAKLQQKNQKQVVVVVSNHEQKEVKSSQETYWAEAGIVSAAVLLTGIIAWNKKRLLNALKNRKSHIKYSYEYGDAPDETLVTI
jgi:hypothetical protein